MNALVYDDENIGSSKYYEILKCFFGIWTWVQIVYFRGVSYIWMR